MERVIKRDFPVLVRPHVRGALQPGVAVELHRYFNSRPDVRACEAAEHGFDPVSDPARYLAAELAEPEHKDLRTGGPLTVERMGQWEKEEDAEHAGDGHIAKADPTVAGIAVRAADSGRLLMLQRSIADDKDPARGKWEFPGGKLEQGEPVLQGAVREWQEETGIPLPPGEFVGTWTSGPYQGFVYLVDGEDTVKLNADGADRLIGNPDDPDGDDCETLAWWAPSDARKMPALRDEVKDTDWKLIDAAVPDAVFKEQPDGGQVHIDSASGTVSLRRKKKTKDGEPAEPVDTEVKLVKADDEQRIVYGIVLEPDVEDSQGDVVSKEDVELAAHRYLYQQSLVIGDQHRKAAPASVRPIESFIAPCDFQIGNELVRKGSWVLAAHIADDDLWQQVKDGRKGGWSVGGLGKRVPL